MCLNALATPPEVWSCAGQTQSTADLFSNATQAFTCANTIGGGTIKATATLAVSNDAGSVRFREEHVSDVGSPSAGWREATMTYVGKCPVTMTPGRTFVILGADGAVIDPSIATDCMVKVLKETNGVSRPSAGVARDPSRGLIPFVRYTYPNRGGDEVTVTFAGQFDPDAPQKWRFMTTMSGMASTGEQGPDELGGGKLSRLWREKCAVSAGIMFL